jgi:hypothetical protein
MKFFKQENHVVLHLATLRWQQQRSLMLFNLSVIFKNTDCGFE